MIFFGHNFVKQDIMEALVLAAACEHKEAQWLTRVFAGKTVTTREEARDVFLLLERMMLVVFVLLLCCRRKTKIP